MDRADHWTRHAQNWHLVGPPLRPSPQDVAVFERIANKSPHNGRPLRALLLGVTQEIITMRWPGRTQLAAVDRSQAMIDRVESSLAPPMGEAPPRPRVAERTRLQKCDWRNMQQFDLGSQDLVLGDGCFTTLTKELYGSVLRQIHGVLSPHGVFAHRFFLQLDTPENVERALSELQVSNREQFHARKLRLLMAAQQNFATGVRVHDVWELWARESRLLVNWREVLDLVDTLHAYEGSQAVYTFPTARDLKAELEPFFHVQLVQVPHGYPLAERCPIVMCTKKEDP